MRVNCLKLNQDKTEFIVFSPKFQGNAIQDLYINMGPNTISSVPKVKNLGVYLDHNLTMDNRVDSICKFCYWQIRNIGKIRRYISDDACKTLIHALVTSKLDYCNALLYGLPHKLTDRLQRVQNRAARLVSRTRRHEHITPVLRDLHWLPIHCRSNYKILLYTYKSLNGLAPIYLSELIHKYKPTRSLRSESKSLLTKPVIKTSTYGNRRFDYSSATLWNSLSEEVKCAKNIDEFKKLVKTFLFRSAFH